MFSAFLLVNNDLFIFSLASLSNLDNLALGSLTILSMYECAFLRLFIDDFSNLSSLLSKSIVNSSEFATVFLALIKDFIA